MNDRQPVKQFFGDAEHEFHLPPDLVVELERKLGSGIGAIYRRFLNSEFGFSDLTEVLRLGLVGGGADPKDAAMLVTTYASRMTVMKLYMSALPVLDELMSGITSAPKKKGGRK